MIFAIVAGGLTLFSIFAVVLPILCRGESLSLFLEHDKEIYKARLQEMKKERVFGTISEREYEGLLAEEGRRFLTLASTSSEQCERGTGNSEKWVSTLKQSVGGALFVALIIPLVSVTGYYSLGSINMPDQPLQARMKIDPATQSIDVLLKRAENQLARNPDDSRGWRAVAPIYMHLNRPKDAVAAYRNVIYLTDKPSARLKTSLGEALVAVEDGMVREESIELFRQAAAMNPDNPKPAFFLAVALNQTGEYKKAIMAWNVLIKRTSGNAPWLVVAKRKLQLAQDGLDGNSLKNPGGNDMRNARKLNDRERQQFIHAMVESLAIKLQGNPENKAGWKRIIRSYIILGRKPDALQAIKNAQKVFKTDKDFVRELEKNRRFLDK